MNYSTLLPAASLLPLIRTELQHYGEAADVVYSTARECVTPVTSTRACSSPSAWQPITAILERLTD